MAVVELGNLWPGQGGVYIWATRTMGETWGFIGGYLSWVPVILNAASSPAVVAAVPAAGLPHRAGPDDEHHPAAGDPVDGDRSGAGEARCQPEDHEHRLRRLRRADADDLRLRLLFAVKNGSAHAVRAGTRRRCPNFAVAGFLYGTVLLYLLGVETPYNMGAEFLSVRKSGPKMILWGSTALVAIYLLTTLGTMMALPGDRDRPGDRRHRHARTSPASPG